MKFGMTDQKRQEKWDIKFQKMQIPEKKFAFIPVKLSNGQIIWLEFYWLAWVYLDWQRWQD